MHLARMFNASFPRDVRVEPKYRRPIGEQWAVKRRTTYNVEWLLLFA